MTSCDCTCFLYKVRIKILELLAICAAILVRGIFQNFNGIPQIIMCLPPGVGERTDYRYPLRNMNDADIPFTRLDIFKRSFFPRTLSLWNQLDFVTRKSHLLAAFKEGITLKPDKFEYFSHSCDRWALIHHARIRIGCSKLKSHLHNNLHVIEEESCQCGHRSEDPFHFFFECPRYVALQSVHEYCTSYRL